MGNLKVQPETNIGTDLPEGYRETEIGLLPLEWDVVPILEVAARLKAGGTPKRGVETYWGGDVPFVKIDDITRSIGRITNTKEHITEEGLEASSAWVIPENSVLLSMYASIGEVAINRVPLSTNQAIIAILPNRDRVGEDYLYLCLKYFGKRLASYNVQTTQKNVNKGIVERFPIPLPSLPEQKAIAHVLNTVQKAIETTEQIIESTRELKRSLMKHLFTYGPVPVDEAEQVLLKETEIGSVPEHWEVVKLDEICNRFQYGTSQRCTPEVQGMPVLRIPNVIGGKVNIQDLKYTELPDKTVKNLKLSVGDLLFVRTNGRREYVGRCAVFQGESAEALFASYLIRAQLDESIVLSEFVQSYATTSRGARWLSGRASESSDGKYNLNIQILKDVSVPLPPLPEQETIVNFLSNVDLKIAAEKNRKHTLEVLFKTLLHNLMTGRVRVKDLDLSEVEEMV